MTPPQSLTSAVENILSKTVKKGPEENEQIVVAFASFGALLLHVRLDGAVPKILRFLRLDLEDSMTEN